MRDHCPKCRRDGQARYTYTNKTPLRVAAMIILVYVYLFRHFFFFLFPLLFAIDQQVLIFLILLLVPVFQVSLPPSHGFLETTAKRTSFLSRQVYEEWSGMHWARAFWHRAEHEDVGPGCWAKPWFLIGQLRAQWGVDWAQMWSVWKWRGGTWCGHCCSVQGSPGRHVTGGTRVTFHVLEARAPSLGAGWIDSSHARRCLTDFPRSRLLHIPQTFARIGELYLVKNLNFCSKWKIELIKLNHGDVPKSGRIPRAHDLGPEGERSRWRRGKATKGSKKEKRAFFRDRRFPKPLKFQFMEGSYSK